MKPIHALVVAGALALGVVLGVTAVTKTSSLGASARHASAKTITARAHKLDSFQKTLEKALKSKPPKLPKVPAAGAATPVATPGVGYAASAASPQIVYQRPAPIVIHKHSHHGDDGSESDGGGGGSHFAVNGSGGGEGGGGND
jgi:uncharacterized membrane protein YgcG